MAERFLLTLACMCVAVVQGRAVQEVLTMRSLRHPCVLPVLAHFQVRLV